MEFEVVPAEVNELSVGDPEEIVLENALRKARAVAEPGTLTIGCDTDVAVEGRLLGKPAGEAQAKSHIEALCRGGHEVLSGLAIVGPEEGRERSGVERTVVTFRPLGPGEVESYVATGEWRGRSGGYAVQGEASDFVDRIEGDVDNVVGLPLALLLDLAPELRDA